MTKLTQGHHGNNFILLTGNILIIFITNSNIETNYTLIENIVFIKEADIVVILVKKGNIVIENKKDWKLAKIFTTLHNMKH